MNNYLCNFTSTYTDYYQLSMAQVYFLKNRHNCPAIFDYFFRKLPAQSGYAIFAGLEDVLHILENLQFDSTDIEFLKAQSFHPEFLEYLKNFRFKGRIAAMHEGELAFPLTPLLRIEGSLLETQIIETLLLNILNFQTLIATKASRTRLAAGQKTLIEFGLRRAQGPAGYYAARASIVGGFDATSNVRAGRDYNIPVSGTMAHSFIESYEDELQAFRDFSEKRPEGCVLLVDTYNTLASGIPNAITVAKEMEKNGHRLAGIRLDSGDLAYLSKQARILLDKAGLHYVKIAASNQLDEYVINSLQEQQAPIDIFGVGTRLATGQPDAALDGVYKLSACDDQPRLKLSETLAKINLPGKKQVFRMQNNGDHFVGADIIALANEKNLNIMHHPSEPLKSFPIQFYTQQPLLHTVFENGKRTAAPKTLAEIATYSQARLKLLPEEYKRFKNPHIYKVGISTALKEEREKLIRRYRHADS